MIEKAVQSILTGSSAVAQIVGTRIEPVMTAQTLTRPNIVYQRIATRRVYSQSGPANTTSATIQVDCYADSYSAAKSLADAVRLAMNGYRGTKAGLTIHTVFLRDEDDGAGGVEPGQEDYVPRVRLDFEIHWDEPTS